MQRKGKYAAAVKDFGKTEDCSPEAVITNPRCLEIARRFDKTTEQVALDINRQYIASYRMPRSRMLHLVDLLDNEDE